MRKRTEDQQTIWNEAGVEAGEFEAFRQIIRILRSENGCPWDREQTFESLKPCMINEMTEAIAAVNIYKEEKDAENLCEELGDVLLQVVLLAQIAQEEGLFQMEDVIRGISRKMIRRHPHVFHDPQMEKALEQLREQEDWKIPGLWEQIKQAEQLTHPKKDKQKERIAFLKAANEVQIHLEEKGSKKLPQTQLPSSGEGTF